MAYDPNNPWTDAEINALRVYYPLHGPSWEGWAEVLNGRSRKAIQRKAGLLDIFHEDGRKSPNRKRPLKGDRLRTYEFETHRNYEFVPTPDPYETHVMKLLEKGMSFQAIDRQMHWHPGRAKQILEERWKREKENPEQRSTDKPKRFPAYTVDLDGLVRRYESWNAWKNHALKAEGEERVYRSQLKEDFEIYETFE